jgi:hypothetical protein
MLVLLSIKSFDMPRIFERLWLICTHINLNQGLY